VSAEFSSLPPPLPKMPPISEAVAITSVSVHGCGCFSIAVYSNGINVGLMRAFAM
jgi:hypothetical protein